MASVPYPTFETQVPVDATENRAALVAVGRCRIRPSRAASDLYRDVVARAVDQARVGYRLSELRDGGESDVQVAAAQEKEQELKRTKKRYMKEGVAMAKRYLTEELHIDLSVVDVEIVVEPRDLIASNGCLAS